VIDHPLAGAEIHATSWHDPLVTLAAAAGCTERVRLGTAVLVAGIRHPVALAKQLAGLACLAGDRVALGAASGWYAKEYEVFGWSIRERRGRTDECLEAVRRLLEESEVSFHGRHWRFDGATIQPRPAWRVPVYVGGGTRLPDAGSGHDVAYLAGSVLRRIVAWDGWIAPCAGDEAATLRDLQAVDQALALAGRGADRFRRVHVQWVHLVDTDDRERALREQLPAFRRTMGDRHGDQHLQRTYLTGSLEDVRGRLRRCAEAGFDEVVLGPVRRDLGQVELLGELLARDPALAGAGRRKDQGWPTA
jgi:alkanesulfonate monooxygenase SsuD/methylene tetrahydromethanopterin reductase-like flavin-dependent oxidoreductase (luciferase family)